MAQGIDSSAFLEEAFELLGELEDSLLELEENPRNHDLIGRVFRAMHTIKGSGAMFGFDEVAAFTHEVETVFDMVRNNEMVVTKGLIDLTLAARDHIRTLLESSRGGVAADEKEAQRIMQGLRALIPARENSSELQDDGDERFSESLSRSTGSAEDKNATRTYRIQFRPQAGIFASGTNPLLLLNELRELGRCQVVALTGNLPAFEQLDPEQCHTSWDIFLTTNAGENAIRDVFIFVEDSCSLDVRVIEEEIGLISEVPPARKLGEILVDRGDIDSEQLNAVLTAQKPLGARLVEAGIISSDRIQSALTEQHVVQEIREKRGAVEATASIRVPSDRLDKLVNLIGELVTVQARLAQLSANQNNHNLQMVSEEVERLTNELRDNTMSIRMLPIGTTFNKFKRLVRDLSKELGKQVEMTTTGGETELDKTVIDQLNDPLVHIIRNSIDHGVESPEQRRESGKVEMGRIHLSAEHAGTIVLIRVEDDGKGLDPAVLRKKGIEKGLISPETELSEKEIFQLIMAPGFSTAKTITNVSGRGVGMDVVKRSIEALRGTIDISSRKGSGTVITLSLPLTLAIIEGFLVQIAEDYFILPLAAVEECVELTPKVLADAHGRHIINVRGAIVPYINLRQRFGFKDQRPEVEQIVIVRVDDERVGFVVDRVVGQHQTVIKSLGKHFKQADEFSGATILGDGTVALILDLGKMVRDVEKEECEAGQG